MKRTISLRNPTIGEYGVGVWKQFVSNRSWEKNWTVRSIREWKYKYRTIEGFQALEIIKQLNQGLCFDLLCLNCMNAIRDRL